jgi:hypothetical protein
MQASAADRDERITDVNNTDLPADDTALDDAFDLWRDLGGSD